MFLPCGIIGDPGSVDRENESQGDRGKEIEEQPKKKARAKKATDGGNENEQPATKVVKAKKGKGSKSGAQNRRVQGTSDDEIAQLGDKAVKGSQITPATGAWSDADRLIVIKHICSEKVWMDFKINQAKECLFISQNLLGNKRDLEQVHNCWNHVWSLYKVCRRREDHTGGGDRDAQTDNEGLGDDESDDEGGGGLPRKPSKRISKRQMDAFEGTEFYNIIDWVAHDHAEVIRPRAFGSTNPISNAEEDKKPKKPLRGRKQAPKGSDDESGAMLKDLLDTYKSCALNREKLEEEKLKLDQGLLELAKQKEKHEARFSEVGAWEQIMRCRAWARSRCRILVFDAFRLYSYVSLAPYIIPILPQSFPHTRRRFRTSEAFPAPPKPLPGFRGFRCFRPEVRVS
ncbi:hypothetical protein FIBSPDRAFT_963726 [Athelia psychrophila]|uniref:No apical meristem-associated C-terminal domain-containing protein n=1 Tax=Athelia psychrophila TaxID=1759441 RepID=A0A165YL54_9AGAM|nr:hypothetical protein FIBSPDRAFT_963726 [Fibularhizoctonia sp. CBS 109695]